MSDFARLRQGMVDCQIRVADVTDPRVIAAFSETPRENYMPAGRRDVAYLDSRAPLGGGREMLDPMTLAKLIQLADPREGETALVVGAGLGYAAAVLSRLVGVVTAVESDPALAAEARTNLAVDGVRLVEGPLPAGAPAGAPYDLIFIEGAVEDGLGALAAQLKPHGRIIAPAGRTRPTKATIFRRNGSELGAAPAFDAHAAVLPGFAAEDVFAL